MKANISRIKALAAASFLTIAVCVGGHWPFSAVVLVPEEAAGKMVRVEWSDDLETWKTLKVVRAEGRVVSFEDHSNKQAGSRFYRGVTLN
jgi:hypothetical protein